MIDNIQVLKDLDKIDKEIQTNSKALADFAHARKVLSDEAETKVMIQSQLFLEEKELKSAKDRQQKTASFSQHRAQLYPGEPCPLCGALEHPYLLQQELIQLGSTVLDLAQKEQELLAINEVILNLRGQISKNEGHQEAIQKLLKTWEKDQKELQSKLVEDFKEISLAMQQDELRAEQLLAKRYLDELNRRGESRHLTRLIATLERIKNAKADYERLTVECRKLYSGEDIKRDAAAIEMKVVAAQSGLLECKTKMNGTHGRIQELVLELQTSTTELQNSLAALGYASIENAQNQILKEHVVLKIRKEQADLAKSEIEHNQEAERLKIEFNRLKYIENEVETLEDLKLRLQSQEQARDLAIHQIGSIEQEIRQNETLRQKLIEETKALETLQSGAKYAILLDHYIGDAQGSKYAKYAQNLNFSYLVGFANNRMKTLTDRYLITPSQYDGDFRIVDLYQGGTVRSVKTLSGGESFLVSLALALSLSDIASKNVKLESLFIDEGFGTLDAETLELAIVTLEKLQAEGNKTIGIISHIDSLKERINTQIQIEKNNVGFSEIKIIGS